MSKLTTISDLSKILNLKGKTNKPANHTLRYWEKEFKQIKPKIINKRRYYSPKQIEIIKLIKFLIKDQGMTIVGAKNLLNLDLNKLDDTDKHSLKTIYYKKYFKDKSKNLLDRIKKLKKYGKKNSHQS